MDCKNTELNASFGGVKVHPNALLIQVLNYMMALLSPKELLLVLT